MKQLIFIFIFLYLFIVFIIPFSFAMNLTGGESITFDVGEEFEYYDIVGNSTTLEYLTITFEGTNVTLEAGLLISSDSFTLVFFNEKEVIKEVYVGGGGGGSRTIYKDKVIDKIIVKEVEKIVEVTDDEEIDRLVGIADETVKKEHTWKIFFVIAAILTIVVFFSVRKIIE